MIVSDSNKELKEFSDNKVDFLHLEQGYPPFSLWGPKNLTQESPGVAILKGQKKQLNSQSEFIIN